MANTRFQARRTSTAGRTPNTTNAANSQYIYAGEFGLNMADRILYSSDGTNLIEIGANNSSVSVTNNATISNNITATNNVSANNANITSVLLVGNSTVNAVANSTALKLSNSTSNVTIAIPTTTDWNAGNKFLNANGSWVSGGGAANPVGSNTQIQYNDSAAFNGATGAVWFNTNNTLTVSNTVIITGGGNSGISVSYGVITGTSKRLWIQSAETNQNTFVVILPNGTSANASLTLYNGSNITNYSGMTFYTNSTSVGISQITGGTGTAVPFLYNSNTTVSPWTIATTGKVAVGVVGSYTPTQAFEVRDATGTPAMYLSNSTSNTTLAVPTAADWALGTKFLNANGSWLTITGSLAGSNTQVQFNDSTTVNASAAFVFDKSTNTVTVSNQISVTTTVVVGNSTVNVVANSTAIKLSNSTSNTTVAIPAAADYTGGVKYLNANGSWVNPVGGANTQVLFNDSGAANGTAGFTFDKTTNTVTISNTLVLGATTTGAASNSTTVNIYGKDWGGLVLPTYYANSGFERPLQGHLARSKPIYAAAYTGNTALSNFYANTSNSIALTAASITTGSNTGQMRRVNLATGTTAGTTCSIITYTDGAYLGNAAGYGGFWYCVRWNATTVADRFFIGLKSGNTVMSNANPTAQTNIMGVGWANDTVTNMTMICGNATVTTNTTLGSVFPISATDPLELIMYAPPNSSTVTFRVTNLVNGDVNTGTMPASTPVVNTILYHHMWVNNNNKAASHIHGFSHMYMEMGY